MIIILYFTLFVIWYINEYGISDNLKKKCEYFLFKKLYNNEDDNKDENDIIEVKPDLPKYENKFLNEIQKLDKDFTFDENDHNFYLERLFDYLFNNATNEHKFKEDECEEFAKQDVINRKLKKLENCFVIEFTPHGNVIMTWNNITDSFLYYSDNIIPYRFLEVVSRKYVLHFKCRPIFVDMEEQLVLSKQKWEKQQIEKEEIKKRTKNRIIKKNVFVNFKSYNNNNRVSDAMRVKNSIPNKRYENDIIILKEKANKYLYKGKIANFDFLKKPDKKIFNKKLTMTFADFKNQQF